MSRVDDLMQWMRDRLDEDEQDARNRRGIWPSPAVNDDGSVCLHVRPGGNMAITWYRHPAEGWDDMAKLRNWADTEHGWTQERVLREIDTKRRILRDLEQAELTLTAAEPGTSAHDLMTGAVNTLRRTARLHAEAYDQRPGYREEWRP